MLELGFVDHGAESLTGWSTISTRLLSQFAIGSLGFKSMYEDLNAQMSICLIGVLAECIEYHDSPSIWFSIFMFDN